MESIHRELDTPGAHPSSDHKDTGLPSISALFLIYFDNKIGYKIGWKRALPPLEIEGIVEYKSLPSGLHAVKEDLIYFVHENYVGLSAFVNAPSKKDVRNACMIAVGVMVPLEQIRLESSWGYSEKLKEIASKLASDISATQYLENFWEQHKSSESAFQHSREPVLDLSPSLRLSGPGKVGPQGEIWPVPDGSQIWPWSEELSMHDPARSFASLLEIFGPLIFPIYRAALLRQRILIMAHPPVREACNFVYNISILSTILRLSSGNVSSQQLRPLFSIGVADIPMLERDQQKATILSLSPESSAIQIAEFSATGWIACTTDKIIATKNSLYDIIITMPPTHSANSSKRQWPTLESSGGIEIKASQRDLRRYKTLEWVLSRRSLNVPSSTKKGVTLPSEPETPSSTFIFPSKVREDLSSELPGSENIVEPTTWSALAYSGVFWWSIAAEQRNELNEEMKADLALMADFQPSSQKLARFKKANPKSDESVRCSMAIVTYFRRLTVHFFGIFSDLFDVTETEETQSNNSLENITGDSRDELRSAIFNKADVARMGLDAWSPMDYLFIQAFAKKYYGRRAIVEQTNIQICGVKVC